MLLNSQKIILSFLFQLVIPSPYSSVARLEQCRTPIFFNPGHLGTLLMSFIMMVGCASFMTAMKVYIVRTCFKKLRLNLTCKVFKMHRSSYFKLHWTIAMMTIGIDIIKTLVSIRRSKYGQRTFITRSGPKKVPVYSFHSFFAEKRFGMFVSLRDTLFSLSHIIRSSACQ